MKLGRARGINPHMRISSDRPSKQSAVLPLNNGLVSEVRWSDIHLLKMNFFNRSGMT